MGRLDGKVAFITGGARGQGRAIAQKFAGEGADIALLDICADLPTISYPMAKPEELEETASLVRELGRGCVYEVGDVRDQKALDQLVRRTVEELGSIDVVCANAGIFGFAPAWEMEDEVWDEMLSVVLTGTFKTIRAVAPQMMSQRSGSVILTGSSNSSEPLAGAPHYVAAKHGVLGLMRNFAIELGAHGIRVNAILPGPILTVMGTNPVTREQALGKPDGTHEEFLEATRVWHALRGATAAPPSVIADAAIWLASEESAHVTGIDLAVDAGHFVLPGMNPAPVHEERPEGQVG